MALILSYKPRHWRLLVIEALQPTLTYISKTSGMETSVFLSTEREDTSLLPTELLLKIFNYVNLDSVKHITVLRLSRVCKRMRNLVLPYLFRELNIVWPTSQALDLNKGPPPIIRRFVTTSTFTIQRNTNEKVDEAFLSNYFSLLPKLRNLTSIHLNGIILSTTHIDYLSRLAILSEIILHRCHCPLSGRISISKQVVRRLSQLPLAELDIDGCDISKVYEHLSYSKLEGLTLSHYDKYFISLGPFSSLLRFHIAEIGGDDLHFLFLTLAETPSLIQFSLGTIYAPFPEKHNFCCPKLKNLASAAVPFPLAKYFDASSTTLVDLNLTVPIQIDTSAYYEYRWTPSVYPPRFLTADMAIPSFQCVRFLSVPWAFWYRHSFSSHFPLLDALTVYAHNDNLSDELAYIDTFTSKLAFLSLFATSTRDPEWIYDTLQVQEAETVGVLHPNLKVLVFNCAISEYSEQEEREIVQNLVCRAFPSLYCVSFGGRTEWNFVREGILEEWRLSPFEKRQYSCVRLFQ